LITPGNFDDDLARIAECDWIVEAVAENLEIKRALLAKVEQHRTPGTIVTTNTSGLPVASIVAGMPTTFAGTGSARIFSIRRATCGCWR
jgi:3-hydroxyacyl-CoA dehydrogenase